MIIPTPDRSTNEFSPKQQQIPNWRELARYGQSSCYEWNLEKELIIKIIIKMNQPI